MWENNISHPWNSINPIMTHDLIDPKIMYGCDNEIEYQPTVSDESMETQIVASMSTV